MCRQHPSPDTFLRPHPLPPGNLDLLKVSLPVKMFEPRSYLQKLADPWVRLGAWWLGWWVLG